MIRLRTSSWALAAMLTAVISIPLASQVARKPKAPRRNLTQALTQNDINFIRPGVAVKIVSASVAKDGTISARVNLTDPKYILHIQYDTTTTFTDETAKKGQTYLYVVTALDRLKNESEPSPTIAATLH